MLYKEHSGFLHWPEALTTQRLCFEARHSRVRNPRTRSEHRALFASSLWLKVSSLIPV